MSKGLKEACLSTIKATREGMKGPDIAYGEDYAKLRAESDEVEANFTMIRLDMEFLPFRQLQVVNVRKSTHPSIYEDQDIVANAIVIGVRVTESDQREYFVSYGSKSIPATVKESELARLSDHEEIPKHLETYEIFNRKLNDTNLSVSLQTFK